MKALIIVFSLAFSFKSMALFAQESSVDNPEKIKRKGSAIYVEFLGNSATLLSIN